MTEILPIRRKTLSNQSNNGDICVLKMSNIVNLGVPLNNQISIILNPPPQTLIKISM